MHDMKNLKFKNFVQYLVSTIPIGWPPTRQVIHDFH